MHMVKSSLKEECKENVNNRNQKIYGINANLGYWGSKARIGRAKLWYKTEKTILRDYAGFWVLFVSNGIPVVPCLGALKVLVADAKLDRSSLASIEIWPEAANVKSIAWWAEKLSLGDEDQRGCDNGMKIIQNRAKRHAEWTRGSHLT